MRSKNRSGSRNVDSEDDIPDNDLIDDEASEEVFCNPWALKCHRDHLKKIGLLSPGPSTPPNLVNAEDQSCYQKSSVKRPQLYLLLENLVSKYKHPCVLDLKVGTRQYADDVSAAKKARKIAKAANTTLATLGLRLTGMQVYNHSTGNYICQNKYYGRTLNQESFCDTIEEFFKYNSGVRNDVIHRTLSNIQELLEVITKLESYRFYTASLLITYDGNLTKEPFVDVRLIDFAHSTHKGFRDEILHEGPDSGFAHGLKNLVQILEQVLQKHNTECNNP